MVLRYHGQPGAEPGVKSAFGARGERGFALGDLARSPGGKITLYLAYCTGTSPQKAEEVVRDYGDEAFPSITIAFLNWRPAS